MSQVQPISTHSNHKGSIHEKTVHSQQHNMTHSKFKATGYSILEKESR